MAKQTIEALVDGGNASAGPPLGPALGPTGINVNDVIAKINEKTKDMAGMKIPVKVIIDPETKEFEVKVGSPPTSALIKKELGLEKGTQDGTPVGNLEFDQLLKIVKMKKDSVLSYELKGAVKEVLGACKSVGVTVEEKSPKEISAAIDQGEFDERLAGKPAGEKVEEPKVEGPIEDKPAEEPKAEKTPGPEEKPAEEPVEEAEPEKTPEPVEEPAEEVPEEKPAEEAEPEKAPEAAEGNGAEESKAAEEAPEEEKAAEEAPEPAEVPEEEKPAEEVPEEEKPVEEPKPKAEEPKTESEQNRS